MLTDGLVQGGEPSTTDVDRSTSSSMLSMVDISKRFGEQVALNGVGFEVEPGEVHGLAGQNGSGKSTLIKVLAGVYSPEPGARVTLDGRVIAPGSPVAASRAGLRFVHQNLGIIGELSVLENMALTTGYTKRRSRRIDWSFHERETKRLLDRLGVHIDVNRRAGECQHVERTAIAIARALEETATTTRVLVLDEPTAALPPTEVTRLFTLIEQVRSHGVGVIYVTHRLDELDAIADRVSFLRDGTFRGTFPISELDRSKMVELIVGRQVEEHRRSRSPRVDPSSAPGANGSGPDDGIPRAASGVVLRVRGLRSGTIDDVSLDLRSGEVVGVAGIQGSGREEITSALFGAVASEVRELSCGNITFDHHPGPRRLMQAGVALVLGNRQKGSAVAEFTVQENITLPFLGACARRGVVSRRRELAVTERWIEALDIRPPDPSHRFGLLSGGNQQKVVLAKWLNRHPTVLLLEDPTSGVDIGARQDIYRAIARQAAGGMGVVLASTDVKELTAVCDRVIVLGAGVIRAQLSGRHVTEERILDLMMARSDVDGSTRGAAGSPPEVRQ